jgi:hypothetical protein
MVDIGHGALVAVLLGKSKIVCQIILHEQIERYYLAVSQFPDGD